MTCEEAAQLIEAEGRLGRGQFFDPMTGNRCAIAVVANLKPPRWGTWSSGWPRKLRAAKVDGITRGTTSPANDAFEGTPEERCVYMAAWFRAGGKA